jgi:hypothetical protein
MHSCPFALSTSSLGADSSHCPKIRTPSRHCPLTLPPLDRFSLALSPPPLSPLFLSISLSRPFLRQLLAELNVHHCRKDALHYRAAAPDGSYRFTIDTTYPNGITHARYIDKVKFILVHNAPKEEIKIRANPGEKASDTRNTRRPSRAISPNRLTRVFVPVAHPSTFIQVPSLQNAIDLVNHFNLCKGIYVKNDPGNAPLCGRAHCEACYRLAHKRLCPQCSAPNGFAKVRCPCGHALREPNRSYFRLREAAAKVDAAFEQVRAPRPLRGSRARCPAGGLITPKSHFLS